MNRIVLFLAAGFGAGFSPIIPGTAGTLLAVPLWLLLSYIPFPIYAVTIVAFFFLSVWASDKAQDYWGNKDDRRIVIDEFMGFFVTMLWVPRASAFIILGFFLFRFFDILKPPPARQLESVKGGLGVVLDDVAAGVYANIVLQIVRIMMK